MNITICPVQFDTPQAASLSVCGDQLLSARRLSTQDRSGAGFVHPRHWIK